MSVNFSEFPCDPQSSVLHRLLARVCEVAFFFSSIEFSFSDQSYGWGVFL